MNASKCSSLRTGYKLSVCLGALMLYNSFNESNKQNQPWIETNIKKISNNIAEHLKETDVKLYLSLKTCKIPKIR